jgi:O-6-methylguanine DNA methyltransferase
MTLLTKSPLLSADSIYLAPRPRVIVMISQGRVHLEHADHFCVAFLDIKDRENILMWLTAYSEKKSIPWTKIPSCPPFHRQVYETLSQIPMGTILSYGDVAARLGSPKAARAVGNACRLNILPLLIPCHRIIGALGHLGGYTPDLTIKKELLDFEGVNI